MRRLCEIFGHPENAFPTIHVAGTNGKGSVCTKIAAALQSQGYIVGLYTSPHISSFCERIQVNGRMISEEEISALFAEIPFPIAFFEAATLLAFLYFRQKQVDIAVIETGIGGRLDATNVIHPLVSVITSIGYDHTEILGSSLEKIAQEKGGIIKQGVPVVVGPHVPYALLEEIAKKQCSPIYQNCSQDRDYDRENQETAHLAIHLLRNRFPVSEEAIKWGLTARPPCRFECHWKEKEIIFDAAHNPSGFARLLETLDLFYPNRPLRFVVGFSKGKNIAACAYLVQQRAAAIHLVSSSHPRLASIEELKKAFSLQKSVVEESIVQGVQNALQSREILVIAGSFFIMEEARKALARK